ncbi:chitin synthase 1 [Halteromyces radiatus]|uniref:chitin synthase 1 n=1 Tax=Halteromyces radiatus TaxID=101107 RepID=UPI00221F2081|nr:chitin synthase 1 [Halteromyces radiatus]KAI8098574.1 chitin synthase 1 [Halteromyces radiatus]
MTTREQPIRQTNNNDTSWTSWFSQFLFNHSTSSTIENDKKEEESDLLHPSLRRQVTRRIQLTRRGHLVLECRIADRLLEAIPYQAEPEFRTMRYTAICCDADQFATNGYTLRQQLNQRKTELMIVITMYNEDHILFARTLYGVMKNISHLCNLKQSSTWGTDAWKKVVVTIVADGRKVIHPRVISILSTLGVFHPGVAKNQVDQVPVQAHLYEYTTQISIDGDMNIKGVDKGIVPVQILLCIKEKNKKKIDSHRWCFNAFGNVLQPNVCVLLDVGTRPGYTSIYELWKVFDRYAHVAGACGEIRASLGTLNHQIFHPLIAAQNFEYKMSNILEKPMESVFGMISVLPGAFSAYRYQALQNDMNQRGPLASYFCTQGPGLFERNMYLAEDRILCFELVAKRQQRWLLHYVKTAFAETDVPNRLDELLSQRRRWVNGSFFAAIYSLWHFYLIPCQSRHSWSRIFLLSLQAIYNIINIIFNWLAMGNFYISFYFITKGLADPSIDPFGHGWGLKFFDFFQFFYLFLITVLFISSIGNRPQGARGLFYMCVFGFTIIMAYMIFGTIWQIYQSLGKTTNGIGFGEQQKNVLISLIVTYGIYFVASILYFDPMPMVTSFFQYLLLLPLYVNILTIYSFCNTHDVSWGTKGDNGMSSDLGVVKKTETDHTVELVLPADEGDINLDYEAALNDIMSGLPIKQRNHGRSMEDYYRSFRTYLLLLWITCNVVLVEVVTSTDYSSLFQSSTGTTYMMILLWVNAGLNIFRFFGSFLYLIIRVFSSV